MGSMQKSISRKRVDVQQLLLDDVLVVLFAEVAIVMIEIGCICRPAGRQQTEGDHS